MVYIKINKDKCKGCMLCVSVCPKGLLKADKSLNKKGVRPADFSQGDCTGCLSCAIICPDTAIEVYK